jgi:uncharacterized damage-inducible protein DinB
MTTPEQLIEALDRGPQIVIPLIRQAPDSILTRRPPSGKWSIHEHACHLAVAERVFAGRLDLMLKQSRPVIRSYEPGRDDPDDALLKADLEESISQYVSGRAELVRRLCRLSPDEWQKTAEHDEYNSYSMVIMFRHLALHDFFHAYRIEELVLRKDWPPPAGK